MIVLTPSVIRSDSAGEGHYGASRGSRTHKGIDYLCEPGAPVFAPCSGKVTKHGYPYPDLSYHYIQITDGDRDHRLFYCYPLIEVGEYVTEGQIVAEAEDITARYPGQGMQPHIHYEVKEGGEYINPVDL